MKKYVVKSKSSKNNKYAGSNELISGQNENASYNNENRRNKRNNNNLSRNFNRANYGNNKYFSSKRAFSKKQSVTQTKYRGKRDLRKSRLNAIAKHKSTAKQNAQPTNDGQNINAQTSGIQTNGAQTMNRAHCSSNNTGQANGYRIQQGQTGPQSTNFNQQHNNNANFLGNRRNHHQMR